MLTRRFITKLAAGLAASLLFINIASYAVVLALETGGYPWADAPKVPKAVAGDNITWGYKGGRGFRDPWGYDLRNCTSYVAWRVSKELGVNIPGWGNAENWSAAARSAGYRVDNFPEPGDIAQWDSGHVAFVEEVIKQADGSRQVKVAEYNQDLKGNFQRGRLTKADHYIDINGTGKIWSPPAEPAAPVKNTPYDYIGDKQIIKDDQKVYQKTAGVAWPLKNLKDWTPQDANYWGGEPVAVAPAEIKPHLAGDAVPPDNTIVSIDGQPDKYVFKKGGAYKLTEKEAGKLSAANQPVYKIPAADSTLTSPQNKPLKIKDGSLYKFGNDSRVRQMVSGKNGDISLFMSDTAQACLKITKGEEPETLPSGAADLLEGYNGKKVEASSLAAKCRFPKSTVFGSQQGKEWWQITGDGVASPFQKVQYKSLLDVYSATDGSPVFNDITPDMAFETLPTAPADKAESTLFVKTAKSRTVYRLGQDKKLHAVNNPKNPACTAKLPVTEMPESAAGQLPPVGEPAPCAAPLKKDVHPASRPIKKAAVPAKAKAASPKPKAAGPKPKAYAQPAIKTNAAKPAAVPAQPKPAQPANKTAGAINSRIATVKTPVVTYAYPLIITLALLAAIKFSKLRSKR